MVKPVDELVRISMKDGSITYGVGYQPDAAAKVFWDAVSRERNCR